MSQRLMERAIAEFGSEEKLGAAIGYTQHGVNRARQSGRITPRMAYRIHVATNGRLHYLKLCPLLDHAAQLAAARASLNGGRR